MVGYDDNQDSMSSSSVDEVATYEVTQEIREQQIIIIFDYPRR
jgi:hypothetical protein